MVNTFDTLVDELEKFIPIKKIHENGIIEFAGNEFGIIMGNSSKSDLRRGKRTARKEAGKVG